MYHCVRQQIVVVHLNVDIDKPVSMLLHNSRGVDKARDGVAAGEDFPSPPCRSNMRNRRRPRRFAELAQSINVQHDKQVAPLIS